MALLEEDVVLVGTTKEGDSKVALPITRANNVEGLGRFASTVYTVGDIVYVDSNMKIALKCITGGTTSAEELDFSNATIGEGVIDGGVVWLVIPRGVMQGSTSTTNGVEGLVPAPSAGEQDKFLRGDGTYAKAGAVDSVNGQTGDVTTDTFPVGAILPFSGDAVPVGYLTCNGASVSRTLYADLFAVIGTTYGAGDGSTTFNLPNLGSNIVSDVATGDLAVKGNGYALGITNGSQTAGVTVGYISGENFLSMRTDRYGTAAGATGNTSARMTNNGASLGITTDGSKSGLVASMTATKTTVKYCIKY